MASSPRPVASDLAGLILTACTLFLVLSLATHNAGDNLGDLVWPLNKIAPADKPVYPETTQITNACGWIGAFIATCLFTSLGLTAYLVAVTPAIAAYRLWKDHEIPAPGIRSCGWSLTVLSLAAILSEIDVRANGLPVVGAGGCLGAMLNTWLHDHFATAGAVILTLTLFAFGMLLWTDYVLVAATLWATRLTAQGSTKTIQLARKKLHDRRAQRQFGALSPAGIEMAALNAGLIPGLAGDAPMAGNLTGLGTPFKPVVTDLTAKRLANAAPPGEDEAAVAVKIRGRSVEPTASEPPPPAAAPAVAAKEAAAQQAAPQDAVETEEEVYEEEAELEVGEDSGEESDHEMIDVENEDGSVSQIRKDKKHSSETPVRTPKQRKEERQNLNAEIQETAPAGAEEYILPSLELLTAGDDVCYDDQLKEVRRKAKILEKTFADFGFNVRVVEIETGPVIAQYEVELEAGLRLSKITGLSDDLAIALRVPSVRIVAPIPGKNTVGIEVPNEIRQVVRLREVIEEAMQGTRKLKIPIFLGKDVSGGPMVVDLASMPHLLIAGRTGTGKSVCLNAIITSILMTRRPDEVRMLMIDPKMVELSGYGRLPHLMHPVVTDMRKAEAILNWAVDKMEERYALLARAGVRHISSYNQLGRDELMRRLEPQDIAERDAIPDQLPYIVIVADEIADMMMTAGKEVEQHIIRLAQKSRAVGIHLILATQKPTVDVITGLIKSNLPARICFQVASRTDSRVVLDENGADKLLGNGDLLFLWPGTSTMIRGQGTYLSDPEIEAVVAHCSTGEQNFVGELMNLQVKDPNAEEPAAPAQLKKRDELYESAVDVVVREGRGSVSLLQRALGIGYGRAARLIDFMAEDGIVGDYNGSQAREVVITLAQWDAMREGGASEAPAPASNGKGSVQVHGPAGKAPPQPRGGLAPKPSPVPAAAAAAVASMAAAAASIVSPLSEDSSSTSKASDRTPPSPARRRSIISRGSGWDDDDASRSEASLNETVDYELENNDEEFDESDDVEEVSAEYEEEDDHTEGDDSDDAFDGGKPDDESWDED